jgi:hypothetical protein
MAERRAIKSDIWGDEFFGELSFIGMALWVGLFSKCADDQGRILENLSLIKSDVFPYKDIPLSDIEECLNSFDGHILRYKKAGRKYIQLVKWWDNQPLQYAVPSNYPEPDGWTDRYRTNYKKHYVCFNWTNLEDSPDGILLHTALGNLGRVSSWHDYLGVLNPNPKFNPNSLKDTPNGEEETLGRTEAIKKGDLVDMQILSLKNNDPIAEYPPDVQDTIKEFVKYFPVDIPNQRQKGKFSQWIKESRELKRSCAEFGLSIISELHATCNYSVSHPYALYNTATALVGKKRAIATNVGYTPPVGLP